MGTFSHDANEEVTINNINPGEINDCANQLNDIFNSLTDLYGEIKSCLNNYVSVVKDIVDCDNTFTKSPVERQNYALEKWQFEAVIRTVNVINNTIDEVQPMLTSSSAEDSINIISSESYSLHDMAESLIFYISIIQSQLANNNSNYSPFSGDVVKYFESIKENPDWNDIKKDNAESTKLKLEDPLYKYFHSKDGEKYDYVDFALDHLGIAFLKRSYSSFAAAWYNNQYYYIEGDVDENGKPISYPALEMQESTHLQDNWCAEFVTYVLFNTGNDKKIPKAYINVQIGMNKSREVASSEFGQWHPIEDSSYMPVRGDIFYKVVGNDEHTGIILGSDDKYIYTIEGNTCNNDGKYYVYDKAGYNMGGYVNIRVHKKDEYGIVGYYSPNNVDGYFSQEKIDASIYPNLDSDYVDKMATIDKIFASEIDYHNSLKVVEK